MRALPWLRRPTLVETQPHPPTAHARRRYEAGSHKQRSARLGPGATAGVIVGAAAAAVLVAAAAVFAAVRLRRRGGGRGLDCKATIRSVGAADKV